MCTAGSSHLLSDPHTTLHPPSPLHPTRHTLHPTPRTQSCTRTVQDTPHTTPSPPAGLQHLRHELIDDVTAGGYCFTDGCGMMSSRLAGLLRRRLQVVVHGRPYQFAALQMRYGCVANLGWLCSN